MVTKKGEITISRTTIDEIETYEVMEHELQALESGGVPSDGILNLAIALLSAALSFWGILLTTTIQSPSTLNVCWVITLVCTILGIAFVIIWYVIKKDKKKVFEKIRERKSTKAIREEIAAEKRLPISEAPWE